MRFRFLLLGAALVAGALIHAPSASACGGCFIPPPPPGESNSVVTDHRMVMAVSKTKSTLYDQIKYQGNPSEFAWVLPTYGLVEIGLSADSLFGGLDAISSVFVQQPPDKCPGFPSNCPNSFGGSSASSSSGGGFGGASYDAGVVVIAQQVVGPYETVQLHPTSTSDPGVIERWLTDHAFTIPADVKPILAQYVKEQFNFLAIRLQPGKSIQSMRPVRVTSDGAGVALPLRMVAAGTGAKVGITLWVVSEGRYEPQNFQSFIIRDEEITWDWATSSSNYAALRTQKAAPAPGKSWEIESAITTTDAQIENAATSAGFASGAYGSNGDYIEYRDPNTGVLIPATEARTRDFTALSGGTIGTLRVTRMRADLSRAALATDLTITAAKDQKDVDRTRFPKLEKGQPNCTIYVNCQAAGVLPRDQAIAHAAAHGGDMPVTDGTSNGATSTSSSGTVVGGHDTDGTFACETTSMSTRSTTVAGGLLAVVVAHGIRRRRQRSRASETER